MGDLLIGPLLALTLLFLAIPVLLLVVMFNTWGLRRRVRLLEERLARLEGPPVPGVTGTRAEPARSAAPRVPWEAPGADAPAPVEPGVDRPVEPVVADPAPGSVAWPAGSTPVEASVSAPETPGHSAEAQAVTLPAEPLPIAVGGPAPPTIPPGASAGPPRPAGPAVPNPAGSAWLSRVGALLLILGVGFFLQMAFERQWVGPGGRVAAGVLVGLAGLVIGERLQRAASRVPAQGLVAAAIGILLLTGYAAHVSYGLVGLPATLAALALVMIWAARFSIRHDARVVGLLAAAGGFLAPALFPVVPAASLALLAYLALVDAGWLLVSVHRRWGELMLLAFVATQLMLSDWLEEAYRPESLTLALPAVTLLLVLFAKAAAVDALRRTLGGGKAGLVAPLLVPLAPLAYVVAVREMLGPGRTRTLAILCAGLGLAYLVAGRALRREPGAGSLPGVLHTAVGLGLLTAALGVHLSGPTLVMAWAVEAWALVAFGRSPELRRLRMGGLAVFGLAILRWLEAVPGDAGTAGAFLVAHPAFPALAVLVVALLGAAWLAPPPPAGQGRWVDAAARPLLVVAASAVSAHLLVTELAQFRTLWVPPPYVGVLGTTLWGLAALPALALARADRSRVAMAASVVLLAAAGAAAVATDAPAWERVQEHLRPAVLNPRFLSGLLLVILFALAARLLAEVPGLAPATAARLSAVAFAATTLFLLWHLSVEVWLMPLTGPLLEARKWRGAALSVLWALFSFAAVGLGIRWGRQALWRFGLLLFGVTVGKVVLVDLAALDAGYRVLSVVVLGLFLLLASFVYSRARRPDPPPPA